MRSNNLVGQFLNMLCLYILLYHLLLIPMYYIENTDRSIIFVKIPINSFFAMNNSLHVVKHFIIAFEESYK